MARAARMLLRRSSSALLRRDGGLLNALRSELQHELSSDGPDRAQLHQGDKAGSFILDWDDPNTQDVVMRRRFASGEEIAVSALLGPLSYEGGYLLPRHALMKVCVKKSEAETVLQFDCTVFRQGDDVDSHFAIENVNHLRSASPLNSSRYKGPMFSGLDPNLRKAFKEYLVNRGIDTDLTNTLLLHLHQKEQGQYVSWLQNLENFLEKDV